ncbi:MAG TPA: sigma-70 family RNA polymerase sigma factor [Candidatus Binatia bacterium]|jgi:RNA polymerase sigma-70 factor (ECF subfamily)|nr:sigma-70 family RNA polymerase sigma factor [Candidatus Binatia bacterium]
MPPFIDVDYPLTSEGNTLSADSQNSPVYLIRQTANQDREAFSQLYDRFSSLVYTLAMRMLRMSSDAEDLLQEVFVQVWHQANRYSEERGSPEAWIVNIARSRAIDKLRSIRRMERSFVLTDDPAKAESSDNVESSAAESETKLTMNSALANLPEAQRKVLVLAYFDGLSQSEIADRLKEPLGTVKTRMRSGIQRLRDLLETKVR